MALRKKGARRIVVDGVRYLWRMRQKPTYGQACFPSSRLVFAVERDGWNGCVLVVTLRRTHPEWNPETPAVVPAEVAACIQSAIEAGWEPSEPGPQFLFSV